MNKHNLKVGQTLYVRLVDRYHQANKVDFIELKVESIGRKWATVTQKGYTRRRRVDIDTLELEDGRGTIWLSPAAYTEAKALREAWHAFLTAIDMARYRPPRGLTVDAINEARAKLCL